MAVNNWIYSGKRTKILGFVSGRTLALIVGSFFVGLAGFLVLLSLIVDVIEWRYRMSMLELSRMVMIRFGLMMSYKRSRELGVVYRRTYGPYLFSTETKRYILGLFRPPTVLLFQLSLLFYVCARLMAMVDVSVTWYLTRLLQLATVFTLFGLLVLLLFDVVRFFQFRKNRVDFVAFPQESAGDDAGDVTETVDTQTERITF